MPLDIRDVVDTKNYFKYILEYGTEIGIISYDIIQGLQLDNFSRVVWAHDYWWFQNEQDFCWQSYEIFW